MRTTASSSRLGALHAAMSGRTELVIGSWHRKLVHVPIEKVIASRNQVDLKGPRWLNVLGSTGQPLAFQDLPGSSAPRASA